MTVSWSNQLNFVRIQNGQLHRSNFECIALLRFESTLIHNFYTGASRATITRTIFTTTLKLSELYSVSNYHFFLAPVSIVTIFTMVATYDRYHVTSNLNTTTAHINSIHKYFASLPPFYFFVLTLIY